MSDVPYTTERISTGTGTWAQTSCTGVPVEVLEETVLYSAFTDNHPGATGSYTMAGYLPKGAVVLGSKWLVNTGFTGDTTATMTVGDGSTADRYNTGTPSVYTAGLVAPGVPSGTKLVTTPNRPVLTVTGAADFTSITAGSVTVSIYYIRTL